MSSRAAAPPAWLIDVPLPSWVRAWPPGLRPARVRLGTEGARLLYLHPDGGWVHLWLTLEPGGVRARPGDAVGFDTTTLLRLAAAVRHRVERDSPASTRWLERAGGLAAALTGDARSEDERTLMAAAEGAPLDDARLAPARARSLALEDALRVLRARHDLVGALEGFDPDARLEPTDASVGALGCRALLTAMAGLGGAAIAQAEQAAERACGVEERSAIAELLLALDRADAALVCLEAGEREGRVGRAERIRAAAEAQAPRAAARAVEGLLASGAKDAVWDRAVTDLVRAGAHRETIRALTRRVAERPSAAALAHLAELHLFTLGLDSAEAAAQRAIDLDPDEERARLVLGAVASARGDHAAALARLDGIAAGPHLATARLWAVRSLLGLGRIDDAIERVRAKGFADRVAWKLWRAYAEAQREPEVVFGGKESYQLRIVLEQMFGPDITRRAYAQQETATALVREAIDRLGGNYGDAPTYLDGAHLEPTTVMSPRNMAIAQQHALVTHPLDEVLAAFDEQAERMPSSPFPRTYRAELVLWSGDYEAARAAFERVWEETHTRWGYVGLGAALGLLGRHPEALAAWEAGLEHYRYLPGEGTYAYRGDVLLALGRLDEAIGELEHAAAATESRIGAWNSLAIARAAKGDAAGARAALDRVAERAPGLLCFAARSVGLAPKCTDLESISVLGERVRRAMAGNRASTIYTFLDDEGRLRALRSAPRRHWLALADRLAPLAVDVLGGALMTD